MMKQGWHSILRPGVQGNSTSFIGGKPCLPPSISLPVCKICGEPLTFFFQVTFPEGHMWAGKSLAFFFCSSYQKHESGLWMPPEIHPTEMNLFAIPDGELDVEVYQTLFRAIVFDTLDGAMREDYQERVVYQEIIWKPNKKKVKSVPIILGGEPIWIGYRNYPKRQPASYQGKPMDLILQIAENFNFEKLSDAPPEMNKCFQQNIPFEERTQPDYTLFCEFNRIYLWGPKDPSDTVVYINVQNDI